MVTRKIILQFFFCFYSTALFGQSDEVFGFGCWQQYDRELSYLADSLEFAKNEKSLPFFLNEYFFDWLHKRSLTGCLKVNEVYSARQLILSRVRNEKVLNWIIHSKSTTYDKLYDPAKFKYAVKPSMYNTFPVLPLMQYSWRDLAKIRLEALLKRKKEIRLRTKRLN